MRTQIILVILWHIIKGSTETHTNSTKVAAIWLSACQNYTQCVLEGCTESKFMNGAFLYTEKQNSQNDGREGLELGKLLMPQVLFTEFTMRFFDMLSGRIEWQPLRPQNQINIFSTPRLYMYDKDSCCKALVFDFLLWSFPFHVLACLVMILTSRFTSSPPLWFLLNFPWKE